jgi:UDPglucose 6-dehydrogenase
MKILYIGAGFVGACSAAVSANSGHKTLVFDVDQKKVELLSSGDRDVIESCLYEKGLGDALVRSKSYIEFTTDVKKMQNFLDECDAVFMCLPTPEIGETGESDLTFYTTAIENLAQALLLRNNGAQEKYVLVINKSTVPIGTAERALSMLQEKGVKNIGVASNPEFLVGGKAVEGAMKPDRIVVGAKQKKDLEIMRDIYQRFYDNPEVKYIEVETAEAEAGKLLANFYLFQKLAICFDVIGRTCEAFEGVRFESVRKILTSDKRIGSWGFYNSLYAGGSCLIKDARSLSYQLQTTGKSADLITQVYSANRRQLELFLSRFEAEAQGVWEGKKVAVIGLSFKRDTNDIRNAPSINIVHFLKEKNVSEIRLSDPAASDMFRMLFPETAEVKYFAHEFEAAREADVIILAADWPQYRGLADSLIEELKTKPVIMDGRRILQHRYDDLAKAGFHIIAVGSSFI